MNFPSVGIVELLVSFVMVLFWLVIPVGVLYLLYSINKRLKNVEELMKKNKDDEKSA